MASSKGHTMTAPQYAVPRILWESLESSLYAASRNFVRSLAEDVLEVPPADLLRAVFPSKDTFKVCLYETDEIRHCMAFKACPTNPDLADRCMRPVLPGQHNCESHRYQHPTVQRRIEPPQIWRALAPISGSPQLYVTNQGQVVTADGATCGKYNEETGDLILYELAA